MNRIKPDVLYLAERLMTVFGRPRVYVKTGSGYFGPDRRRRNDPTYRGPERRSGQPAEILSEERLLALREAASQKSRGLLQAPRPPQATEQPAIEDAGFPIIHITFREKSSESVYGDLSAGRPQAPVSVVIKRSRRLRTPDGAPRGDR